jgi:hypothetical protein
MFLILNVKKGQWFLENDCWANKNPIFLGRERQRTGTNLVTGRVIYW